jgi:hypothetical protein
MIAFCRPCVLGEARAEARTKHVGLREGIDELNNFALLAPARLCIPTCQTYLDYLALLAPGTLPGPFPNITSNLCRS